MKQAAARKIDLGDLLVQRFDIAFLKGDRAGMQREVILSREESDADAKIGMRSIWLSSLASWKKRRCTKPERHCLKPFWDTLLTPSEARSVRLQLARALALAGDGAKAKIAYRSFLALWKDADPDIPILKQAKAELAKLP